MKKFVSTAVLTLLLGFMLVLAPATASAQCTMCKTQVEASRTEKDGYQNYSGLNRGILYLMTVPYLLMGVVGFFWYRSTHQKKKQAGI
ncbi:hypothetical protein LJY25_11440 [Hymenobacter sp. BT175]|uniref:hypothetical protein n=1 Tax=Hymenobacter translucens TaxID=2886507 RepID=UPI001D0E8418|nr:hypothetical protein [Hymenobacter translucens]MCC2547062.1 hypothetical protein [Hymenobacter translucens]